MPTYSRCPRELRNDWIWLTFQAFLENCPATHYPAPQLQIKTRSKLAFVSLFPRLLLELPMTRWPGTSVAKHIESRPEMADTVQAGYFIWLNSIVDIIQPFCSLDTLVRLDRSGDMALAVGTKLRTLPITLDSYRYLFGLVYINCGGTINEG